MTFCGPGYEERLAVFSPTERLEPSRDPFPTFRWAAGDRLFEQLSAGLRENRRARQQPVWRALNVEPHIVRFGTFARQ
jgi:hypothetical protein